MTVAGETPVGLWAEEVGEGPLIVLVHGAMDRSSSMMRVRRLLEHDCRVLRYDRRGYGRSLATGPATSLDQQVADLATLLGSRRAAVLVGHSLGSVICLALAERSPAQVGAVVAYEAPMMWEPWWPDDTAGAMALASAAARRDGGDGDAGDGDAAEAFMRRMLGDRGWERLPARTRAERRREGATLLAELHAVHRATPPYRAERVTVPVVAAFGSETRPQHRRAAEELARRAPHGMLELVEGADHGVHVTHPAALAGLVRRSLRLASDPR
jgi:pimeloyl-ACP methyl ester carboxylesterase